MTRLSVLALVAALSLARTAAAATPDDPRARQFFAIGVQAYGKGQYLMAIESFEQAYAIAPRPGLLFSIAQAHQRQFRAGADEKHLKASLDFYRKYLAADATGNRRGEALAAIQALSAVAGQLRPDGSAPTVSAVFGKLLVASSTPGIDITVNGDRVDALPATLELPQGNYTVVATAPGYRSEKRELKLTPGLAVPLGIELEPLPARIALSGPTGAEAFLDGRPIGILPLSPLSLPAGDHWLSLRKPGKRTRNARIELARGDDAKLALELESTTQRRVAWVVGGVGAASLVASGVFAGLALHRDSKANDFANRERTVEQARAQNDAIDDRDRFRSYAIGAGIGAIALIGLAAVLYVSDTPDSPQRPDSRFNLARSLQRGALTVSF